MGGTDGFPAPRVASAELAAGQVLDQASEVAAGPVPEVDMDVRSVPKSVATDQEAD